MYEAYPSLFFSFRLAYVLHELVAFEREIFTKLSHPHTPPPKLLRFVEKLVNSSPVIVITDNDPKFTANHVKIRGGFK